MKVKHITIIFFCLVILSSCEWTTSRRGRRYDPSPVVQSESNYFLTDTSIYVFDYAPGDVGGWETNHYPDGSLKSEGNYNNGQPSGNWKFYYNTPHLLKKEGNISNGQFSGYWKFYHPNGRLRAEGNFENGFQNGHWKFYYPNGIMESEGNFDFNRKTRDWKYYYDNGRLYAIIRY